MLEHRRHAPICWQMRKTRRGPCRIKLSAEAVVRLCTCEEPARRARSIKPTTKQRFMGSRVVAGMVGYDESLAPKNAKSEKASGPSAEPTSARRWTRGRGMCGSFGVPAVGGQWKRRLETVWTSQHVAETKGTDAAEVEHRAVARNSNIAQRVWKTRTVSPHTLRCCLRPPLVAPPRIARSR